MSSDLPPLRRFVNALAVALLLVAALACDCAPAPFARPPAGVPIDPAEVKPGLVAWVVYRGYVSRAVAVVVSDRAPCEQPLLGWEWEEDDGRGPLWVFADQHAAFRTERDARAYLKRSPVAGDD